MRCDNCGIDYPPEHFVEDTSICIECYKKVPESRPSQLSDDSLKTSEEKDAQIFINNQKYELASLNDRFLGFMSQSHC